MHIVQTKTVGEFGAWAVLVTAQPTDFRRLSTVFAAFSFKLEPVLDSGDAVAEEEDAANA